MDKRLVPGVFFFFLARLINHKTHTFPMVSRKFECYSFVVIRITYRIYRPNQSHIHTRQALTWVKMETVKTTLTHII